MINRTGFVGMSDTLTSAAYAKTCENDLRFEELLLEKTFPSREKALGIISERLADVYNVDLVADSMEYIIKALMSIGEGGKSIWEIVLQLEEHVDPKLIAENLNMDFDETAGLNSIAGLLARYWKKKELLEEKQAEDYAVFLRARDLSEFDDNAVSELTALTLKKKAQRLVTEV